MFTFARVEVFYVLGGWKDTLCGTAASGPGHFFAFLEKMENSLKTGKKSQLGVSWY